MPSGFLTMQPYVEVKKFLVMYEAVANGGPKPKPNSVKVSVTLKNDANGSEKPNANALRLGDSVPISQ